MPKTRQQKEEIVKDLTDRLSRAKSIVFADYQGLTMAQLSDLRGKLGDVGSEFTITKNSLLKLALPASSLPAIGEARQKRQLPSFSLEGPTATLFAYEDELAPIKILTKVLKDTQTGSVKLGIFNYELVDDVMIQKLASLPSKEELKTRLVRGLSTPLYGIVGVLQANLRNLVYALDAIRVQKGGV